MLGEGESAKVYNINNVAVKRYPSQKELTPDIIRELSILTMLKGQEGFVQLIDINLCIGGYSISLVLYNMNLKTYINRTSTMDRCNHTNIILTQLLRAVNILDVNNIDHNDIKPANVLIGTKDDDLACVLCDFGCCIDARAYNRFPYNKNSLGLLMICYLGNRDYHELLGWEYLESSNSFEEVRRIVTFSEFQEELDRCNTVDANCILDLINFIPIKQEVILDVITYPIYFTQIMEKIKFHPIVYINALKIYEKLELDDIYSAISCIYVSMSIMEGDFELVHDLIDFVDTTINANKLHIILLEIMEKIRYRGIWI